MNLITNSYHAMQESGGVLSVALTNIDFNDRLKGLGLDAVPHILLSIEDTGIGMDEDTLAKIFDPYFTTKPIGKGTGLGLSVVHGIVKNYRGELEVRSRPGKGSVFNVYLPAFEGQSPPQPSSEKKVIQGGKERILLVDDEISILKLEKEMLERLGYEICAMEDSHTALSEIKNSLDKYDLLITDMTMPKVTGERLAREAKSTDPHFPIIVCTGFSEQLTPHIASDIGINAVLAKPVLKTTMAQTIRKVLDERLVP